MTSLAPWLDQLAAPPLSATLSGEVPEPATGPSFDCSVSEATPEKLTCVSRTGVQFTVGQSGINIPIAEWDQVRVSPQGTDLHEYGGVVRPRGWTLGQHHGLSDITWTEWSHSKAKGSGTYSAKPCVPDCASSAYESAPATFTLTQPELRCGHFFWTRLNLEVQGEPAAALDIGDIYDVRAGRHCATLTAKTSDLLK
ncbi:MAG TPA: hypothetical protein VFD59_04090 [Nocardioidaceae bacterium]|nr:hypothetical protein [Nocardioidaceae bacterium]